MFDYIPITYLNDFIFCPRSIYFHQLCEGENQMLYHRKEQTNGRFKHESVENKNYSTKRNILQGIYVYSEKYKLCGKIDLFDIDKGVLSERKARIKEIYDGYVFQLYAQYFSLMEMGYAVNKLSLYSYDDNKSYDVLLPKDNIGMFEKFEKTISRINGFNFNEIPLEINKQKCLNCVYEPLCDVSIC